MPLRYFALATLSLRLASPAYAQLATPEASPHARVEQTMGLTELSVDYHRPGVRGREIWGALVPFDEVWRAGANENTVFETSTDIRVEGRPLPAGRYGFHVIPTTGSWLAIFSTMADGWGSYSYDPSEDAIRVPVAPRPAPHGERLLFRFDDMTDSTATLVLHWEEVELPIRLSVATPEVVLASMARELRGRAAFQWDTWDQAAAYALEHRMRLDDALDWTERSAGVRPTFQAAVTRAAILDALGRGSEANTVRRAALELDATEAELNRAGRRMLAARMPAHAITVFRHAVAEYPDAWGTHAGLADAMVAAGDRAGAAEHYRHAIERAPDDRRPALEEALARAQGAPPAR
jgi:hypothetical protein